MRSLRRPENPPSLRGVLRYSLAGGPVRPVAR